MNAKNFSPPVTDELPIAIRAYAIPTWRDLPDPQAPKRPARRKSPLAASSFNLTFDTETTTDAGQALRFGTYQWRKGDHLIESGIFYDPDGVTAADMPVLQRHAADNGLVLRTRDEFVDEVFYARAYQLRATIVGFNLPFDISRLAISHSSARTPQGDEANAMRGGFTFKLSQQKIYPNIRVKHMSRKAALIGFAAPMGQADARSQRNRGFKHPVRRGHFIDVKTLASALFAKGFSLASLSKFLQVPKPKLEFDDFDGPITDDMVRYAVRDVQATWECYATLTQHFAGLKLGQSIPEKIYSEAGIGKAYLKEMGIQPWRKVQPDVPPALIAKIMGSYFGGRSEVRIRREIRQVILCDFLSMYPTVGTLMGLWRFVIADGMSWRDATVETREFLDRIDLAALQSPETWQQLTTLVRILPDADIFPVRAAYSGEAQSTIGANFLSSDTPLRFTLADCVASKMLTGKSPQIVEAIKFAPGPAQAGLRPINIAGNAKYRVDPNTTDFFKRVIEMRQFIKRRMGDATGDEQARLDTEQNSLKICANSTSYGIWVEVNVETRPARKSVTVLSSTCDPFSFLTDKAEMPGTFFHPLLATLITGAARLMLALAERLATDQGLDWAFCDTDSMALAKPDDFGQVEFAKATATVVEWFAPLNPYEFGGSILQIEAVNRSLETGKDHPLYCLAISSKRYALFNLGPDNAPIMRKVSAHGLGHLLPPYPEDDAPAGFPTPDKSVLRDGTARWHCDLWHQIVAAVMAGHPDQVRRDYHPALSQPAISQYSATSPDMLRWFKTYNANRPPRDQVKPFGFLLAMSATWDVGAEQVIHSASKGRPKKVNGLKPVAPFDRDNRNAVALAFDRETGAPVSASSLRTYADALAQYHISPESKFVNADFLDRGTTLRRHIRVANVMHIGKEAHDWERQAIVGINADSEIVYGVSVAALAKQLLSFVQQHGEAQAAQSLGISKAKLTELLSDKPNRSSAKSRVLVAARLAGAIERCAMHDLDKQNKLADVLLAIELEGLRPTARRLRIDPSNLRRKLARRAI